MLPYGKLGLVCPDVACLLAGQEVAGEDVGVGEGELALGAAVLPCGVAFGLGGGGLAAVRCPCAVAGDE